MEFAQILFPCERLYQAKPEYRVRQRKGNSIELQYGTKEVRLQVHRAGDSNHMILEAGGSTLGKIEWGRRGEEKIVRGLKIQPEFQGHRYAHLLAWLALRDMLDLGIPFENVRAEGIMEATDDAQVDPRAAHLFVKLGFNCVDRQRYEEVTALVGEPCLMRIYVRGKNPHYKAWDSSNELVRIVLMMPEEVEATEGPSRGIVTAAPVYMSLFRSPGILSDVVKRGAAYISGDYHLNPEFADMLMAEVSQLPSLAG